MGTTNRLRAASTLGLLLAACAAGPGGPGAGPADAAADAGLRCEWELADAGTRGGCPSGSPGPTGATSATIPLDGGSAIVANLSYANRGGRVLQGDLFLPPPAATAPGILVMIHGGGWLDCSQRRDKLTSAAAFFAADLEVAVFNVEYRLVPEGGGYPANLGDVKCAVQFIAAHAADYGLDGSKVAVIGESAGAQLALMAALTEDRPDLDPDCGPPIHLRAAIAYSAPSDLPALAASTSPAKGAPVLYTSSSCASAVAGCEQSCDRCVDASPRAHACGAKAPILIVHAPDPYDGLLPQSQAESMAAALAGAGAEVRLVIPLPAAVAAQTWGTAACSAQAGIAHGFQSPCLLIPTYLDLATAVRQALGP